VVREVVDVQARTLPSNFMASAVTFGGSAMQFGASSYVVSESAGAAGTARFSRIAVVSLSAYFVVVWGSGFVASRIALQYAAPFSYIGVRYGIAFLVALLAFGLRARWPATPMQWGHVAAAGLLSHAGYLGGSHYAQRWGLSAGITAAAGS
jgi:hypothetical protein